MKISVIIPAYNEGKHIGATIRTIQRYLEKKKLSHEIIIVDDGSTDNTRSEVKKFKKIILTAKRKNRGKGYSIKEGMLLANGDYALFTDADLSTPIEELDTFLSLIQKYDIVIGSRALKGARVQNRWYRALLGKIGNVFISLIAVKGIRDTQCGFKLFRRSTIHPLFTKQTIDRFGFDFEILHIAQKKRYSIKEQPVTWINSRDTKVTILDYPKTLFELLKIEFNDLLGRY